MTVMAGEAVTRARAAARARAETRLRSAPAQYGRQARQVSQRAQVVPGNRQYQSVILAEFLAAMLLVTLSPVAYGGSPNAKAKGSPSPYDANDLKQLVAVGATYFVLALFSSGGKGRLGAWLGGLILIAIAMSKASQGKLAGVFTVAGEQPGEARGPQLA